MPDQLIGAVQIVASRPDGFDVGELDALLASPAWRILSGRVREMLREHQHTCATASEALAVWRAQGAIAALERVLKLPEMLRAEGLERTAPRPRR